MKEEARQKKQKKKKKEKASSIFPALESADVNICRQPYQGHAYLYMGTRYVLLEKRLSD